MTCGAPHPERALACESVGTHADHAAWVKDEGHVFWPNDEYVAPPPPVPAGRGRGAAQARLHGLAQLVPPKTTSVGPLTPQQATGRADGMHTSYKALRDDAEMWAVVMSCVRQACETKPRVSTNDVWDLLLRHPGFHYDGEAGGRGWMGSLLSQTARAEGLVGDKIDEEPNRQDWAHSGLPVNVYPSRVYRGA